MLHMEVAQDGLGAAPRGHIRNGLFVAPNGLVVSALENKEFMILKKEAHMAEGESRQFQ